jgi:hypothetical protein
MAQTSEEGKALSTASGIEVRSIMPHEERHGKVSDPAACGSPATPS